MARRASVVLVVLALVGVIVVLPATRSTAQNGGSPVATPSGSPIPGLSLGAGTTVKVLASGRADQLPGSGPFVLERITLAPGAATGMRQIPASELLSVESGSVTAIDSLGLQSTLNTGAQSLLTANATYEVRNTGSSPASFLRLRLAEATTVAASNPPTQAAGTPAAKPAITTLFQGQNETFPSGAGTLFLADITYAPGADTGQHSFTGPVGFFVVSGTLSISSPSGLTGQLPAGKGIVLPAMPTHRIASKTKEDSRCRCS